MTTQAVSPAAPMALQPMATFRTYAQLVRLPNLFTAFADVALGGLAVLAAATPGELWPGVGQFRAWWPACVLLFAASGCLYSAGMVWNDFFDVEQDRRERPFRPIPSGRVSRPRAALLAGLLSVCGIALAALAGWRGDGYQKTPLLLSLVLLATILAYDSILKRTWVGPLAMGSCRFLNVLLGLSLATEVGMSWGLRLYLAFVVGLYIAGVTWFARTEARQSSKNALAGAGAVMLLALILAVVVPVGVEPGTSSPLFPYLLVVLAFWVGLPAGRALETPTPKNVQTAVKRALFGLVVLDAILATAVAGTVGLVILLLLVPGLLLGRWIYST
jgi:4-hydroxybenzoate polyprenyltransferase